MDLIKSLETAKLQITKTCTRIITSGTRHKYRKYGQNKEQVMGIELERGPQSRSERGIRGIVNVLVYVLVQFFFDSKYTIYCIQIMAVYFLCLYCHLILHSE